MRIIKIDKRLSEIIIAPESSEDLWHLEKIVEKGDIVSGSTDRKIKPAHEGEKAQRQVIFVELEVEDAHFQEFSESLKVNGVIIGGHPEEFIELKSHQSLNIKAGEKVKVKKKSLKSWQIDRLKKAQDASVSSKLLVILMDDEEATLAFVSQFSIDKKATIKAGKRGKMYAEEKSTYFDEVLAKTIALAPNKILVAGPGFVKENFKKFVDGKKMKGLPAVFIETVSSVGETGFGELTSQGKLATLEKELQLGKETIIIEEFLAALAKGKAEYGKKELEEALTNGAVEKLIIAESYLMEHRAEAEKIMDLADKTGCDVCIISSKNPKEKSIHSFGGAVAILRYKKRE